MKAVDFFRLQVPDSFCNYEVLPEPAPKAVNIMIFKEMEVQEDVTNDKLDEIMYGPDPEQA